MTQQELDRLERRAVKTNALLLQAGDAFKRGKYEKAEALVNEAREMHWTTRRELIAAGAEDSIRADSKRVLAGIPLQEPSDSQV